MSERKVTINLWLGFLNANHTLDAISYRRRTGRKRILLSPDWYERCIQNGSSMKTGQKAQ